MVQSSSDVGTGIGTAPNNNAAMQLKFFPEFCTCQPYQRSHADGNSKFTLTLTRMAIEIETETGGLFLKLKQEDLILDLFLLDLRS